MKFQRAISTASTYRLQTLVVAALKQMAQVFAVGFASIGLLSTPILADDLPDEQKFPDVIDVQVSQTGDRTYRFDVTMSSPYDSPSRYADAFRVLDETGEVELGLRTLWHDHANEQPFTRSLQNVRIADNIQHVMIQGRDQVYGYGGRTIVVDLPR